MNPTVFYIFAFIGFVSNNVDGSFHNETVYEPQIRTKYITYIANNCSRQMNITQENILEWVIENDPKLDCAFWCYLNGTIMRDKEFVKAMAMKFEAPYWSSAVGLATIERVVDHCISYATRREEACSRAAVYVRCVGNTLVNVVLDINKSIKQQNITVVVKDPKVITNTSLLTLNSVAVERKVIKSAQLPSNVTVLFIPQIHVHLLVFLRRTTNCTRQMNLTRENFNTWIIENDPTFDMAYWCLLNSTSVLRNNEFFLEKALRVANLLWLGYVDPKALEQAVDACIARALTRDNVYSRAGVYMRCTRLIGFDPASKLRRPVQKLNSTVELKDPATLPNDTTMLSLNEYFKNEDVSLITDFI